MRTAVGEPQTLTARTEMLTALPGRTARHLSESIVSPAFLISIYQGSVLVLFLSGNSATGAPVSPDMFDLAFISLPTLRHFKLRSRIHSQGAVSRKLLPKSQLYQ